MGLVPADSRGSSLKPLSYLPKVNIKTTEGNTIISLFLKRHGLEIRVVFEFNLRSSSERDEACCWVYPLNGTN